MTGQSTSQRSAFVIMPFGDSFDTIYEILLRSTLADAGFIVQRADKIESQQAILGDIIRAIEESNLIVADLTDQNPNVYYELGIAHALNKPVILLTQSVVDLPFDLKSYRVVPYSTELGEAMRAKDNLAKLLEGVLDGSVPFSSPVSDFLQAAVDTSGFGHAEIEEEELGIADYVEDLERDMGDLTTHLEAMTERTSQFGEMLSDETEKINLLMATSENPKPRQFRSLFSEVSNEFDAYGEFLAGENTAYEDLLSRLEVSLEGTIRVQEPSSDEERQRFEESLDALDELSTASADGLAGVRSMAESIESIPPIERKLNRSRRGVTRELRRLAGNIERTVSIVSRAADYGRLKLEQTHAGRMGLSAESGSEVR